MEWTKNYRKVKVSNWLEVIECARHEVDYSEKKHGQMYLV